MYKKIMLYFLLINTAITVGSLSCAQETTASHDNNDQEDLFYDHYDHLDYLADNQPEIASHEHPVPQWVKSFFVGLILNLAKASEYWHKIWKNIRYAFSKNQS
jgi:hypothetical protein